MQPYASVVLLQIEYLPDDMSEARKVLLFSLAPQICLDLAGGTEKTSATSPKFTSSGEVSELSVSMLRISSL
jgi:hypothetical protein